MLRSLFAFLCITASLSSYSSGAPPDLNSMGKRVRPRRTRLVDEDTGWWMRTGAKVENKTTGWQGKDQKGKLGIRANVVRRPEFSKTGN